MIKPLGAGGVATVYLAEQESLERQVALKVMNSTTMADESFCKRFLKEGRLMARMSHRNLMTVHDIGVRGDYYYLAMEYLPAGTVRKRMVKGLAESDIVRIVREVAAGLQYAHRHGVVHRDIKPGNLLFREDGTCVLADFGIAKAVGSDTVATKIGTAVGTPHYMSPEQAMGQTVDARSDLYSLGIVYYELLTNKVPFDADNAFSIALMHVNDTPPPLPERYSHHQPFVSRLLAKSPDERYEDAGALIAAMRDFDPANRPRREPSHSQIETRRVQPMRQPQAPAQPKVNPAPTPTAAGSPAATVARAPADLPTPEVTRQSGLSVWLWAVVSLAAVALLAASAWWFLRQNRTTELPQLVEQPPPAATILQPAATAAATAPEGPATVATFDGEDLDTWLQLADGYYRQHAYAFPADANATDAYNAVLELDPDNRLARERLDEIAEIWLTVAEDEVTNGNLRMAGRAIANGLKANPANARLRTLQRQVAEADSVSL